MSEPYSRLAGVYDEIVVDPCFPLWADFLHRLWRGDPAGVRDVLDVCCGTGLMAAELHDRGYRVVGVDASQAMLDRAAGLLGPKVDLRLQTLPDLQVGGGFDAAISTFDGLNYMNETDFAASLSAVGKAVRSCGWLVFDLHTDAMLAYVAENPTIEGVTDGTGFVITSDVNVDARTCNARITVTRGSDIFVEEHLQYFHSDDDVHAALAAAGFVDIRRLDEYTEAGATEGTLRATWVARRDTDES